MSAAWSTRGSAAEDARVVILAAAGRRRQGNGANRSTKWSFDGSRTLSVPAWMTRSMVWGLIVGMSTLARRAARTSLFGGLLENQAWTVGDQIFKHASASSKKKVKHLGYVNLLGGSLYLHVRSRLACSRTAPNCGQSFEHAHRAPGQCIHGAIAGEGLVCGQPHRW